MDGDEFVAVDEGLLGVDTICLLAFECTCKTDAWDSIRMNFGVKDFRSCRIFDEGIKGGGVLKSTMEVLTSRRDERLRLEGRLSRKFFLLEIMVGEELEDISTGECRGETSTVPTAAAGTVGVMEFRRERFLRESWEPPAAGVFELVNIWEKSSISLDCEMQ